MIKKTLYFGNPAYLSTSLGQIVVRIPGEDEPAGDNAERKRARTVPIEDVGFVILDHDRITVTHNLIGELLANNCAIVSCGKNHLPAGMMLSMTGNTVHGERTRRQTEASLPLKKQLWQQTVRCKIANQAAVLEYATGEPHPNMLSWASKVRSGDPDNLEGRAAAYYWKTIFPVPDSFTRERYGEEPNNLLNYGYAILRAMAARACCAAGLHPTLGIHHHNRYDSCCLADDLMEPFRCVIDRKVAELNPENAAVGELTRPLRAELLRALLERQETRAGEEWRISDLLRSSAQQLAESFLSGEMKLNYR